MKVDAMRIRRELMQLDIDMHVEAELRQARAEDFARMHGLDRRRWWRRPRHLGLALLGFLAYAAFLLWVISNERGVVRSMDAFPFPAEQERVAEWR